MFEEIGGLPLHPLALHAPVVLVPILALLAIGYAVVPFLRPHLRLVVAALAVIGPLSALVSKLSGDAFFARQSAKGFMTGDLLTKVEAHQSFGNMTVYVTIALGVVTLLLVWMVAPVRRAAAVPARVGGGSDDAPPPPPAPAQRSGVIGLVLTVLTVLAAIASLYYVFRTGDSGARAVWGGS